MGCAIAAGLVWGLTDFAHDLMANVATELAGIAITLAIVERIVQHEAAVRVRPLVSSALQGLSVALKEIAGWVAADYAETHRGNAQPMPMEVMALLELWTKEEDTGDTARSLDEEGWPYAVAVAKAYEPDLEQIRRDHRDYLDPRLVAELDEFLGSLRSARAFVVSSQRENDPIPLRMSVGILVAALIPIVAAYEEQAERALVIDDEYLGLIEGAAEGGLGTQE